MVAGGSMGHWFVRALLAPGGVTRVTAASVALSVVGSIALGVLIALLAGIDVRIKVAMSAIIPALVTPVPYHAYYRMLARLYRMQDALHVLSITDELTGLYNRRHFIDQARQRLDLARRDGRPLSIAVIDIDHFKSINDGFGHAAGDTALREVARAMRATLRVTDVTGRLGGEEFGLLLAVALPDAAAVVEKLRLAIGALEVDCAGSRISCRISTGIAAFPEHGSDVDTLMRRADHALYEAKRRGRDRTVLAVVQTG